MLETPSFGGFQVSIVDAANPVVFVRASDVGTTGMKLPKAIDNNPDILAKLLEIRASAAVWIGLANDIEDAFSNVPSVPKICLVTGSCGNNRRNHC